MKQKLYNLIDRDELILQKLGFLLGALLGVVGGMFVSERADSYIPIEEEETVDGETED